MKKKLKMKSNLKYLILFTIDLILILNLPMVLKDPVTLNNYRFNMIILGLMLITNGIAVMQIEKN